MNSLSSLKWHQCKNVFYISFFTATLVVIFFSMRPWMPTVFFGDDLMYFLSYRDGLIANDFRQAIFESYLEKYRPIFSLVQGLTFRLFGERIEGYLIFNVVLHSVNVLLVFEIARKVSNGNLVFALSSALAIAVSRFALYQLTQVTGGQLEGVALTFFLLCLLCLLQLIDGYAWRWAWGAILFSFLAFSTHERYMVLGVWLSTIFLFMPVVTRLGFIKKIVLVVIPPFLMVANFLYKTAYIGMPFFVGTEGKKLGGSSVHMMENLKQALMSIFGMNEGPSYLAGATISFATRPIDWSISLIFISMWFFIIIRATLSKARKEQWFSIENFLYPYIFISGILLLLIPPISTIRIEQRWLLASYVLVLLCAGWALRQYQARRKVTLTWVIFSLMPILPMAIDMEIRSEYRNIFFVSSGRDASEVKSQIDEMTEARHQPLYFLASKDLCNWTLLNGDFFRLYSHRRYEVHCAEDFSEFSELGALPSTVYTFDGAGRLTQLDVGDEVSSYPQYLNELVLYDFVDTFSRGHLNSELYVDTPTGRGAFPVEWNTNLGKRRALTVVSGHSYSYQNIIPTENSELRFGLGALYPSDKGLIASVKVYDSTGREILVFSEEVIPPKTDSSSRFKGVSIELGEFAGEEILLTFEAFTVAGASNAGHWVGYTDLRIIEPLDKIKIREFQSDNIGYF